jgi:PAS domain-containing protein
LAFYRTFGTAAKQTVGTSLFELGEAQWDVPRLHELLEEILSHGTTLEDFVVEHDFPGIGRRTMLLNARRLLDPQRRNERILLAIEDATERKRAEAALRDSHDRIAAQVEELSRFNSVAVGREVRMIALKKEVNELCRRHGEPARYPLDFEPSEVGSGDGEPRRSGGKEP